MRIAPDELSFATTQAHRDIYAAPSRSRRLFAKDGRLFGGAGPTNISFETDPVEHARMHRLLAPGFRPAALRAREHVIHRYVDLFVETVGRLSAERADGVNMAEAFPWLGFDIMGR